MFSLCFFIILIFQFKTRQPTTTEIGWKDILKEGALCYIYNQWLG